MIDAAVLIPYDPQTGVVMVVISTYYHPKPQFRGCFKAIGGMIEPRETPEEALTRELAEEFTGLVDGTPSPEYLEDPWLENRLKVGTVRNFRPVPANPAAPHMACTPYAKELVGHWHVYAAHAEITKARFHAMRRWARKSSPHVILLDRLRLEIVEPHLNMIEATPELYASCVNSGVRTPPLPNCFPGFSRVLSLLDYTTWMPELADRQIDYVIRP